MVGVLIGVPVGIVVLVLVLTAGLYIVILVCRIAHQQERLWELPIGIEKSLAVNRTIDVALEEYTIQGELMEGRLPDYYSFEDVTEENSLCSDGVEGIGTFSGTSTTLEEVVFGQYGVKEEKKKGKVAEYYSYDDVEALEDSSLCTGGARGPYQGLNQNTRDYTNIYNRLGSSAYQDLDSLCQEEEHRYHKIAGKKQRGLKRK